MIPVMVDSLTPRAVLEPSLNSSTTTCPPSRVDAAGLLDLIASAGVVGGFPFEPKPHRHK